MRQKKRARGELIGTGIGEYYWRAPHDQYYLDSFKDHPRPKKKIKGRSKGGRTNLQNSSPLFSKLPIELRNLIYHFVIGAHRKKGIVHHGGRRELVAERVIDGETVVVGPGKHVQPSTARLFANTNY